MSQLTYVIDLHALLYVKEAYPIENQRNLVLDGCTKLVLDGKLNFPSIVSQECDRLANGESVSTWAKAIAGSRKHKTVAYDFQVDACTMCQSLVDEDDEDESVPVFVAAMALQLKDTGFDVCVVSEDRKKQPLRTCLVDACALMDLDVCSMHEFVDAEGLITQTSN